MDRRHHTAIGLAISVLLLAGSIGSLSLKPWARQAMLAYAALAVVMTVVNLVVGLIWILPKVQATQQQIMAQQTSGQVPPAQMAAVMKTASSVGMVVAGVVQLIFPAILAFCYTRPNVKAAFGDPSGGAGSAGGPPYGEPPSPSGYYAAPPQQQPPRNYPPPQG